MFTLNCKGRLLEIKEPIVMGIVNITPDSFYSGSRSSSKEQALQQAEQMLNDGATIIDIGGQSTRPDSTLLLAEEEMQRVIPTIEAIRRQFPGSYISIDTFYSAVASEAVKAGADIINDISGGHIDTEMLRTVAALNVPYICMHMKGTPQTMKQLAQYRDVVKEVSDYFIERMNACRSAGIKDIIIDPGFGFAKNSEQNFELLKALDVFNIFDRPILLGISRKSTIYKTLQTTPEKALNGTTVLNTVGLMKGASILRVHDVKEAVEAVKLTSFVK